MSLLPDYRATGVAISMVAARFGGIIGNIVIATLLDMYCPAPTFIVAFLLISKLELAFNNRNRILFSFSFSIGSTGGRRGIMGLTPLRTFLLFFPQINFLLSCKYYILCILKT